MPEPQVAKDTKAVHRETAKDKAIHRSQMKDKAVKPASDKEKKHA